MDIDDPHADFAPMVSDVRGNRDVVLLFDQCGLQEGEAEHYLHAALAVAGPHFQGAWIRYGTITAEFTFDKVNNGAIAAVTLTKYRDANGDLQHLIVAELEDIHPDELSDGLGRLVSDPAFMGVVALVGPSEFRSQLSRRLEWLP